MSGVRRRGYFAAAVAVLGAALVTALMAVPPDRPVDIRLVAPPPLPPQTVTASAATTVSAVGPVALTTVPPRRPWSRDHCRASPPHRPRPPPRPRRPGAAFSTCCAVTHKYFDDDFERCVPWPLTDEELCEFLDDHHLHPFEIRGREGRGLGLDCD